eukprot:CAMPEP_0114540718 /NCGR_PEP_ID=MMETSP0114-20121206/924_1 /TAXON_ID=31324 /ORGANISM="Goniomonas sp, Strain m" /LENGTH=457 /DNA_ID=CAMNT_0001724913 /DNA_START=114 /DNA_END=1484 /DNA_ORIENTATION=-
MAFACEWPQGEVTLSGGSTNETALAFSVTFAGLQDLPPGYVMKAVFWHHSGQKCTSSVAPDYWNNDINNLRLSDLLSLNAGGMECFNQSSTSTHTEIVVWLRWEVSNTNPGCVAMFQQGSGSITLKVLRAGSIFKALNIYKMSQDSHLHLELGLRVSMAVLSGHTPIIGPVPAGSFLQVVLVASNVDQGSSRYVRVFIRRVRLTSCDGSCDRVLDAVDLFSDGQVTEDGLVRGTTQQDTFSLQFRADRFGLSPIHGIIVDYTLELLVAGRGESANRLRSQQNSVKGSWTILQASNQGSVSGGVIIDVDVAGNPNGSGKDEALPTASDQPSLNNAAVVVGITVAGSVVTILSVLAARQLMRGRDSRRRGRDSPAPTEHSSKPSTMVVTVHANNTQAPALVAPAPAPPPLKRPPPLLPPPPAAPALAALPAPVPDSSKTAAGAEGRGFPPLTPRQVETH